jgi:hypothetical protein
MAHMSAPEQDKLTQNPTVDSVTAAAMQERDGWPLNEADVFAAESEPVSRNAKLAAALALFKGACPVIPRSKTVIVRTRTGGSYSFKYAPLEAIIGAINPVLSRHGLSVFQDCGEDAAGRLHVNTTILHESGQAVTLAPVRVLVDTENGEEPTAQELGSALTYARRQSVCIALFLSPEDDEDGNHASGNVAQGTDDVITAAPGQEPGIIAVVNKIKTYRDLQDYWRSLTEAERDAHAPAFTLRKDQLAKETK